MATLINGLHLATKTSLICLPAMDKDFFPPFGYANYENGVLAWAKEALPDVAPQMWPAIIEPRWDATRRMMVSKLSIGEMMTWVKRLQGILRRAGAR